jgi:hypothetical protein
MSTPVLPSIITGPAVIQENGHFIYVQKDIQVQYDRQSFFVESAHGRRDERHKSMAVKLTFTPVGELRTTADVAKYFPHAPADIGKTIFKGAVVVHSVAEGKTYTYARGGVSKFPKLTLGPTKTPFGDMEITCIGAAATQPTNAAFIKTIATAAFSDTSYDDTKVITDIYTMTIGARSAPYDAVGSIAGFEVEPQLTVKAIEAGDIGIADIIVSDLWLIVTFAPSNLTEAQVDALLGLQDTGAILPGQSYAKAGENLVIDSDAFTLTAARMGAKTAGFVFDKDQHRHRQLMFTTQRTGNITSSTALWTMTVN